MNCLPVLNEKTGFNPDPYIYVIDTETKGLDARPEAFCFGVIYGFDGWKVIKSVEDFKTELDKVKYKDKYIFAHNAEYDYNVLYGNIIKHMDNKAIYNGKFICAKRGKTTFADSMNLFPTTVKKLGEALGMLKGSISDTLTSGKGSYTKADIDYCVRDCEIVWEALTRLYREVGSIKLTLGSCSVFLYRQRFQYKNIYHNDYAQKFFESYYGGRCEAYKIGHTYAYKYDVNSMYPYVMKKNLYPNPADLRVVKPGIGKLKWYLKHKEGQATLTVRHKVINIPCLPVKRPSDNKLIFPVGRFRGTWTFPEIRYALYAGYIEIERVHEVVYSKPEQSPFDKFINVLYDKRRKATGIMELIYKLLMNNLYGKFCQRDKMSVTYYDEIPADKIYELLKSNRYFELKIFNHERSDCYLEVMKKRPKPKYHTIPSYGAYITAYARVMLLKHMHKYESYKPVYCDTDCIAFELPPPLKDTKKLGGFKLENEVITEIRGLKNYSVLKDIHIKDKIKGVHKSATKINKNRFKFDKQIKTKEGLRRNVETGLFIPVEKHLTGNYDKRIVMKNGNTKPIII